ncbi:MAG: penicillin-binding protein activator [Alphaproteobacteria bacterium]|nr:penicillin-binding protein activator [Alphaproteobacteria bacterium]
MTKKIHSLNLFISLITCLFIALTLSACVPAGSNGPFGRSGWETTRNVPPATLESGTPQAAGQSLPQLQNRFKDLPPVKVAILLPLSGPHAALGQFMLKAAQLALFDTGYENFNLIPRDTEGTTTGASNATRSVIDEGAQLILGPLLSSSVRGAKDIARSHNVNVIAFSTDGTLAGQNTFIMGFMPEGQVSRVTHYALSRDIKNFALIAPKDKYGNLVSHHFEKTVRQKNAALTNKIRFSADDPAIINQIAALKVKGSSPDFQAVFMPVGGTLADMISSTLSYNHLMPNNIRRLGTGLWDDPNVIRQSNMQGAWFAAPAPRTRAKFEQNYQTMYGNKPARLATLAYDATALAAILAYRGYTQSGGINPAFDQAALTDPRGFNGVNGIFRFHTNGVVERGLAILEIREGRLIEIDPAPTQF